VSMIPEPDSRKRLLNSLFRIIISIILLISLSPAFLTLVASFAQTSTSSKETPDASKGKKKKVSSTKKQTANESVASDKKRRDKKRASTHSSRLKKRKVRGQREIESPRILEIQKALAQAGYYKDRPSGKWDAATSQAMSDYQGANGFKKTGRPDALSLKKLGL